MSQFTILQVVPRLNSGGSELATLEIAAALVRAGARALVATAGGRMAADIRAAGGEIVELPLATKNPLKVLANSRRISRLIDQHRIDLVHARSRAPAWSALIAAGRTGIPFVTTFHGAYGEAGALKALYNSVMGRGDLVIANSSYTAAVIAARHAKARERIRVIYRGVEPRAFDPAAVPPEQVAALRQRWGVPPGVKIILQAGRLTGLKGQRDTIEAAAELQREHLLDDAVIIFAGGAEGKGSYREELIGRIAAEGLEDKVKLVGHCSEMPAAFLTSHVALMPSRVAETFGRASIEAQAMQCPVIVSNLGALPETLVAADSDPDNFTGWLVPPEDAGALARRISDALSLSVAERAEIGARARAHAARFSLSRMQEQTLAVYDELLGGDLAGQFRRANQGPAPVTAKS